MPRFTDEQRGFGQAMKLMIDLYYQLKNVDPKFLKLGKAPIAWLSEPMILKLAEIFHLTIPNFSPCLYFAEYSKFRYRGEDEEITITNGNILRLFEAIEALKADVSKGLVECYKIKECIVELHKRPEGKSSDMLRVPPRKKGRKGEKRVEITIIPSTGRARANTDEMTEYFNKLRSRLNRSPKSFDSFVLDANDSDLFDVTMKNYDIYGPEKSGWRVFSPGYSAKRVSVFDAVVYLLIRYQWEFGSFKRVKVCKQCGKLFIEKRLGAREFCGGTCRKHFNDSLQVPEIRRCRDRQNQWMNNQSIPSVSVIYRVHRDDCVECDGTRKSGECPVLIKKNKKAFNYLAKIGRRKPRSVVM